ncbi:hypothetical protein JM84_0671 [Dokdonia sp. Hel_I_63]|uniref:hypothetical protein n=1 Tax=Dokdonia sp. Hel_I_63 TaxID=1249996 RepID=UPI00119A1675|nr:hypothetical protein [Dokdonia sp. Hel_I_63]TVZ21791.1 hypothetical protein JM84_0671 [Dokdonia sp. Hel_I_63]
MKILKLLFCILLFSSCSSKLKIIDIHKPTYKKISKKDFYMKDKNRSFERLKGQWLWTNASDTLTLKITPKYKIKYDEKVSHFENAYYDTADIEVKYIKNGITVYNDINKNNGQCLVPSPFKIHIDMFYLFNFCNLRSNSPSYLIFMAGGNSLSLLSPYVENEKVLLKKEGEYEVVIPHSIVLDRVMQ